MIFLRLNSTGGRCLKGDGRPEGGGSQSAAHPLIPGVVPPDNRRLLTPIMTDAHSCRQHSAIVVDGPDRAPSRAMLRAVGFSDEDFKKPVVGIASLWSMVTPCNMHIDKLAVEAEAGTNAAGGKGVIFGTITVSDGISMGTEGMRCSLISREVIADSIELCGIGYSFDACVIIVGCDKTIPAGAMALARFVKAAR